MNDLEKGYLAGIIDGEGCVYINKTKVTGRRKTPSYTVKVCVSITAESLVEWFKAHAQLTSIHHVPKPGGNRKPKWLCTWNNTAAEWLLETVYPHLVIKQEQAALGLELIRHLQKSKGHRGLTISDEDVAYREGIKQRMSLLNQRGIPTPPKAA